MRAKMMLHYVLAVSALAPAGLPAWAADFACDVRLDGSRPSILLISAADRGHAVQMAVRARIGNVPSGPPVRDVRECILRRSEQFADPQAAQILRDTPM